MAKSQERHGDHQSLTLCPTFIRLATKYDEYIFFCLFFYQIREHPNQKKKKTKKGRGQS